VLKPVESAIFRGKLNAQALTGPIRIPASCPVAETDSQLYDLFFSLPAGIAAAQEAQIEPGSERPMFTALPGTLHSPRNAIEAASTPLQTWNGSFTHNGTTYTYNMVGVAPATNGSASITTYVIPVKIVISNGAVYDPSTTLSNGKTATQDTMASPIFTSSVDFTSGETSMGMTQYIDAFQRANFWGHTPSPNNYHLLLGATVKQEQTLKPPSKYGTTGTVFGFKAGLVDINWFDSQAKSLLTNLGITPNTFAIFLTYNVYLTTQGRRGANPAASAGIIAQPVSQRPRSFTRRPAM